LTVTNTEIFEDRCTFHVNAKGDNEYPISPTGNYQTDQNTQKLLVTIIRCFGHPMNSLNSFNLPNPSSRTMTLGFTLPIKEMTTRNLSGGKAQPASKADNLAAICEPIVWKM
jgi:hypothetical protein